MVNSTYTVPLGATRGYGYTPQSRNVIVNGASVGNQSFVGTSGFNISGFNIVAASPPAAESVLLV